MTKNNFAKMLAQLIREYQASGFVNGTILDSFAEFLTEKTFKEQE